MGQAKFFISLTLIALFTIAILSYSIGFGRDNNADVKLEDDAELSGLQTNLISNNNEDFLAYNDSEKSFRSSVVESGDNALLVGGTITDSGVRPRKSFNYILTSARLKIFGGDVSFGIIINAFMGIIIFLGIVYAWKTIKGGNPD